MKEKNVFKDFDELPMTLTVEDLSKALRISRPQAYILANSGDIPTIRVGKRILILKDSLISWIRSAMM